MTELWRKLSGRSRRDARDAELQEEMEAHLAMKAADTGDPLAARRQFGNTTLLLEDSRAAWGWPRLESWLRDFRYALRVLARRPGFTATVVLTLGLGIGSSSTIFSLIDAVLLRPLPYPHPERLVAVYEARLTDLGTHTPVAPGRLEDWQRLNRSFDAIAGSRQDTITDTTGPVPERLSAAFVSPCFFSVLGSPPSLGRVFTADEERPGGPLALLISDGLWQRRFSRDPAILGRRLILKDQSYVIVGVMPRTFQYPMPATEIWVPDRTARAVMTLREARFYFSIARLKRDITPGQAQADLAGVQTRLGEQYPKTDAAWSAVVEPLKDVLVGRVRPALWLLLGSVSLLLLIACANVACLLLARLNSRAAEVATRLSLGAGRAAIARQLFVEGLVYALGGGVLGMSLVFAGTRYLRTRVPDIPRIGELAVDARLLLVVGAICVAATVLFSLGPVLQTFRQNLAPTLIRGGRGIVGGRQRLPRVLVSAQLALATALLIGAGLFLRSMARLEEAPLGFRPDHVLTLHVSASFSERPEATVQRHQRILDALSSVQGVAGVAMSAGLPGVNPAWPREFEISGEPSSDGALRFATWRIVTAGYFQTLDIPILGGRSCRMSTDPATPFEALVNRSFAGRYFPGRDPIGRTILQGPIGNTGTKVVGVVADAREDGQGSQPQPVIYACGFLRYWPDSDFLIQAGRPASVAAAVREAVRRVEPSRPIYSLRPMAEALEGALAETRFRTLLVSLFSMMALALAAIGLYGVMSYMVVQRTREIGIRVALGARPGQIAGEVVRVAGVLAAAGVVAGVVLAAGASKLLGSLLYGISPSDTGTYLVAAGVLFAVALFACLAPSRRATSIDAIQALREQ